MKYKLTYKELSLLLGILVAIIIVLTLWIKPISFETVGVSKSRTPHLLLPATKFVTKTAILIQESFR